LGKEKGQNGRLEIRQIRVLRGAEKKGFQSQQVEEEPIEIRR
jgi:hypothetical protein